MAPFIVFEDGAEPGRGGGRRDWPRNIGTNRARDVRVPNSRLLVQDSVYEAFTGETGDAVNQ